MTDPLAADDAIVATCICGHSRRDHYCGHDADSCGTHDCNCGRFAGKGRMSLDRDDAIVAEAGKRADAATPGPWKVRTHDGLYAIAAPHSWVMEGEHDDVEAPFIAAARTDIPALRAIADKRGRALREAVTTLDDIGSGEIGIHMAVRVAQKVLARIREILGGE